MSATPATAVEVVTSLGGSVVSIDTLTAAPTAHRRGRIALVAGLALLSLGLATFFYGLRTANHDAAARERWIAEKRPSWAFRPTRHSPAVDVLAALGVIAGVGCVATGLLRRRDAARTRLRVGQNDGVDIPLADAPPEQTLVEHGAGGFVAPLANLDGDVAFAGTSTTLASMRAAGHVALPLYVGTQVRTRIGQASFFVRGIEAPVRTAPPAMAWERAPLAFLAASAMAHLMLWGIMQQATEDQGGAPTDMSMRESSTTRSVLVSTEDMPVPPDDGDADDSGKEGDASAPTAIALDTGTLGHDSPNPTPAKLQVADRGLSPRLSREQAIEAARDVGILSSDVFAAGPIRVAEGGNFASGFDDMDITGGLFDGGGTGAPAGSFGWGVRGTGTGCGTIAGVPCSGVASDPFGTLGRDDGHNYLGLLGDDGHGNQRRRTPLVPKVVLQPPVVCSGAGNCLDKELIRRYIRRNIEKISYCYEKELLAQPGLQGTVTANFTLNGNGRVVESSASGVDPTVSSCIAEVISHVQFPKVGETGVYPIKYPFQLRPRG
ncbi:MAG: AgmX/PglI C-terminal domain-containing protein [Myxococcales bacterium]|nr:AgmX/PglI C-terminal domain-containing protein [Myxococcales bacterium]